MRQIYNGDPALRRTLTAGGVVVLGFLATIGCGRGAATTDSPSPESTIATASAPSPTTGAALGGVAINPHVPLDATTFCTWRFGTHPIPLSNRNPVRVRIDDRCNYPSDPDPKTDQPTGVYSSPAQNPAAAVNRIPDGTDVTVRCYTTGEHISDAVGNESDLWLGITEPDGQQGYVPDVNVGGGYTQEQLAALGLKQC